MLMPGLAWPGLAWIFDTTTEVNRRERERERERESFRRG
jgi:hypothetical protein